MRACNQWNDDIFCIYFHSFFSLRKNNIGHHIVEKTDLPDELIHDVAGTLGFQDTQPRVS